MQAHASEALLGRLLDRRYRIGPLVARGGMASVHEAVDERLDRRVAVKIMHASLTGAAGDHDFAERFVREARAAARLSHPHVVAVHDQGEDDGTVFLVMELVRGHTLREAIDREAPMRPARALALLEPVVSALAAAHRAGLVHRDVKPENVLIADDGTVKVADFGLARAVTADTRHTATQGVLIGTVSYLAPELVVDGRSDARADVYAVGVLLHEMLTGVKPHQGESPIAVAYKHVHHDVPPPSRLAPGLPPYVDALVARAAARDRTRRPADAGVLLRQLHQVAQALAEGVADDPELTLDLLPHGATPTGELPDLEAAWDAPPATERITVLPAGVPPPPVEPPRPADGPPGPVHAPVVPPRRRRRGRLLLVLALVLALGVGGGAFWWGWARYSPAPTVVGDDRDAAVAALEAADLEVAFADPVYDGDAPAGEVVEASPRGGARVQAGDTVTLTLSLGELLVPTTRGLEEDAAQDLLLERQLQVGERVEVYSDRYPAGTVVGSTPRPDVEVDPGTVVVLKVSQGRKPIEVGSWVARSYEEAQQTLEDRGLRVVADRVFDDQVPEGQVISQVPAGGTRYEGDTVRFTVSRGPQLVEVPKVYLFGVEAAEDAMREAGFETRREDSPGGFGLGYVVRTDPEWGQSAPRGSTITLFVV
ncbi:Stk1 family PASTA domain-containing Ser/Thr kinase [Nocardioides litoris]|uniref:Stk1 family PASTA domain-containing Ser/Thr kinase n=1 Tax=Nocardioides litoris TaxID=1926648 RepID=UPI00111F6919|nr:Stk1 family PASTA domain-containing Ser/Thr kinase [Nocardioides litoris]